MKSIYINGIDCTSMFKDHGYSVGEKKILGNNSAITISGIQLEDVLALKDVLYLPLECLSESDVCRLMSLIRNSSVAPYTEIYYFSTNYNQYRSAIFIREEIINTHRFTSNKGVDYYEENTLSFVEQ